MLPSPMQTPPIGGMAPMNTTPPMNTMPPMPPMGKMPGMEMNLDPMARQNFNNMMSGIQSQAMMPPMPMHMNEGGSVNPIMALLQGIGQLFGFGGGQEPSGGMSFGDAFAKARREGKKVFEYNGKMYTTEIKEEEAARIAQEEEESRKARKYTGPTIPAMEDPYDEVMASAPTSESMKSDSVADLLRQAEEGKIRTDGGTGDAKFALDQQMDQIQKALNQMENRKREQTPSLSYEPEIGGPEDFAPKPLVDIMSSGFMPSGTGPGAFGTIDDYGNRIMPGEQRTETPYYATAPRGGPGTFNVSAIDDTSPGEQYINNMFKNLNLDGVREEDQKGIMKSLMELIGMNQGGSVTDAIAKLEKGVVPVQGYDNGGNVISNFFDSVKEKFNESVPTYDSSKYDSASEEDKAMNVAAGNAMGISPGSFIGATKYTYPVGDRLLTFKAGNTHKGFGQDKDPDPIAGTPGGAKPDIAGMTQEEAQAYIKSMAPTTYGTTGDYSDLDTFKNYTFGDPNFQFDDFKQAGEIAGYGKENKLASDINILSGAAEGTYRQEGEDVVDDVVDDGSGQNVADTNTGTTMTSTATTPISPFAQIEQATVVPSTRTVDSTFNPTFTPLASTDIYNPNFLTDLPDFSSLAIDPSQSAAVDLQKFLDIDEDKTAPKAFTPDTTSITDIMKASGYQQGGAVSPGLNMAIDKFISAYR